MSQRRQCRRYNKLSTNLSTDRLTNGNHYLLIKSCMEGCMAALVCKGLNDFLLIWQPCADLVIAADNYG